MAKSIKELTDFEKDILKQEIARQMLVVNYREEKIAAFINGENDDDNFPLLDPIAKKFRHKPDYLKGTTYWKAIRHKLQLLFYLVLIIISFVLGISLLK
jgi:hypothetical protein